MKKIRILSILSAFLFLEASSLAVSKKAVNFEDCIEAERKANKTETQVHQKCAQKFKGAEDELYQMLASIKDINATVKSAYGIPPDCDIEATLSRYRRPQVSDRLRGLLVGKAKLLCKQFEDGVYLRKVNRMTEVQGEKGELHYVMNPRIQYYERKQGNKTDIENGYWHGATVVQKGLKVHPYASYAGTGLFISNDAELAIWGDKDLGNPTKNVKKDYYNDLRKSKIVADPFGRGSDFDTLLKTDFFDISTLLKQKSRTQHYAYNEAQVHYRPNQTLAIYAEVPIKGETDTTPGTNVSGNLSPNQKYEAVVQAIGGYREMRSKGIPVPLAGYHEGALTFYRSPSDYVRDVISNTCADPTATSCPNLVRMAQQIKEEPDDFKSQKEKVTCEDLGE